VEALVSTKALLWLRDQHPRTPTGKLDPDAKLVLYALAEMDNAKDPSNTVWPSQKYLRERTSLSISTIGKKLQQLERTGYIRRQEHRHSSGPRKGQRTSDRTILLLEKGPDPEIEPQAQPEALRSANARRKEAGGSLSKGRNREDEERRRDEWEASLGEEWRGSGPWWDTPADTAEEVVLVDEYSGDIFASRGTFTNFQRATARRRPTEMWQQEDVLQEGIDRLLWVNPQNERDVEVLSRHFYEIERANFVPALEVKAMVEIFDDEDFLNAVGSDTGEAGYRLFDCLKDCYVAP